MMQEIKMPSAGQTTDEATIVAVHVKVGDAVKPGKIFDAFHTAYRTALKI